MPTTIPHLAAAMRQILTTQATATERTSGFVQRRSKLTGAGFAQTLVLGWWAAPAATLDDLVLTAETLGCDLTPQALDQRFAPAAAQFLYGLLQATLQVVVAAEAVPLSLLRRFSAVVVTDGCVIPLPPALQTIWPGCGNSAGPTAALKVLVPYDLLTGALPHPLCIAGRIADGAAARHLPPAPPRSLQLRDLGFFSLPDFARLAQQDRYWLSRLRVGTHVYALNGQERDLPTWLAAQATARGEAWVAVGKEQRLSCRLLWEAVPEAIRTQRQAALLETARRRQTQVSALAWALTGWTLLVTNVPTEQLSVGEALVLARARWQVELLFKRWKSLGQVDEWRTTNPWRILCEVYAKLMALLMQHWLLVVSCWAQRDRSLWKAQRVLPSYGGRIAAVWAAGARLDELLAQVARTLARRGRMTKQANKPATYQLLADPSLLPVKYAATLRQTATTPRQTTGKLRPAA